MSGPQVYFSLPDSSFFRFPPSPIPRTLPPPIRERTFRSPFGIAPWLFDTAMKPEVPFLFAATYILTVFALNAWNRSRNHKPWWIARQGFFKVFVVLHNVALAVYSFATFLAMLRAIAHTWPGLDNASGLAGVADSLCKIHGPRGLGDAVTYNTTINIWESKNQLVKTAYDGNPLPTDVGRLWNEGLAFWGWIFYLSKFYEVLDTFIIVAKGKRSPTLQTYHHAGAMLCMWAGIRYMSPPIWMFVFINSFIHALMYTYFTLAAVDIRVPRSVKRLLTTMQIAQFVFGASYAALHLFVQYDIPIATPYKVLATVASAASSATSAAAHATSSASSEVSKVVETPTATAAMGALVKKLLLRAAGEEGVAERIGIPHDNKPVLQHIEERIEKAAEQHHHIPTYETRWRTDWTKVNCIDTSGEAFAIYLNLFYLFPLTLLFARFFYKAYVKRTQKSRTASDAARAAVQDARKASDQTAEAFDDAGKRAEDELRRSGSKFAGESKSIQDQLRDDMKKMKQGQYPGARRVSEHVKNLESKTKDSIENLKQAASNASTPRKASPSKKETTSGASKETAQEPATPSPSKKNKKKNKNKSPKPDNNESAIADSPEKKPSPGGLLTPAKEEGEPASESQKVEAEDEPEAKQDENIDDSQATRPGSEEQSASPKQEDDTPAAESEKVPAEDESEEKQDANLEASEPTRPGAGADSDAMGESGALIDYSDAARSGISEAPEKKDEDVIA